eukprot:EG_transcript_7953
MHLGRILALLLVLTGLPGPGPASPCRCPTPPPPHPLAAALRPLGRREVAPGVFFNATRTPAAFPAYSSFSSRSRPLFAILDDADRLVYLKQNVWLTAPKWVNSTTLAAIGSRIRPETDFSRLAHSNLYPNFPALLDVQTGRLFTVPFNFRRRGRLHHDLEFNPRTNTFLGTVTYAVRVKQKVYTVDTLVEIALDGTVVWQWDHRRRLPLNLPQCPRIRGSGEPPDCHHTNSLYWDLDTDVVYINVRNLFTFYAVNKSDGRVLWGVGAAGDVQLEADDGWGPRTQWHGVEPIGEDRYVAFNNHHGGAQSAAVVWQLRRPSAGPATARLVRRVFVRDWVQWMGDADLTPAGTVVVSHSMHSHIAEYTPDGAVAWALDFTTPHARLADPKFGVLNVFHFERFRLRPYLAATLECPSPEVRGSPRLTLRLADSIRRRYTATGRLTVAAVDPGASPTATAAQSAACPVLHRQTVLFPQNWGLQTLTLRLPPAAAAAGALVVRLANAEGLTECLTVPLACPAQGRAEPTAG